MKQVNHQALLLKAVMAGYTAFLVGQRAAADAGGGGADAEPPPVGHFPHAVAVEAWLELLQLVVRRGNWFVLQVRCRAGPLHRPAAAAGMACPGSRRPRWGCGHQVCPKALRPGCPARRRSKWSAWWGGPPSKRPPPSTRRASGRCWPAWWWAGARRSRARWRVRSAAACW